MKICETFPPCVEDPTKCGYSINCSLFEDYENGEPTRFIGGIDCPYAKWNKIDRAKEIGHTDEAIETSEFPVYKSNCNLVSCRYNADGKCENEEKRKECVEVSRAVLCIPAEAGIVQAKHSEDGELMLFVDGKFINDKIMRVTKTEEEDKLVFTVEVKY